MKPVSAQKIIFLFSCIFVAVSITTQSKAQASQTVTGIVTDFNGFWKTNTTTNNPTNPNNSHNLLAFTFAIQHEFYKNAYVIPKLSGAFFHNTISKIITSSALLQSENYVLGYGLGFGYLSFLGPLDFTIMRSPQANNFAFYVNLGHNF